LYELKQFLCFFLKLFVFKLLYRNLYHLLCLKYCIFLLSPYFWQISIDFFMKSFTKWYVVFDLNLNGVKALSFKFAAFVLYEVYHHLAHNNKFIVCEAIFKEKLFFFWTWVASKVVFYKKLANFRKINAVLNWFKVLIEIRNIKLF
jgi:hypothetical protein